MCAHITKKQNTDILLYFNAQSISIVTDSFNVKREQTSPSDSCAIKSMVKKKFLHWNLKPSFLVTEKSKTLSLHLFYYSYVI